jgi:hypothetical protein
MQITELCMSLEKFQLPSPKLLVRFKKLLTEYGYLHFLIVSDKVRKFGHCFLQPLLYLFFIEPNFTHRGVELP